jgi:hypothetical protein
MNRKSKVRGIVSRGVVAATAVTLMAGLLGATPAVATQAVTAKPAAAAAAVSVSEASQVEKATAAAVLGIVAGDELMVLNDRNFVFALWSRAGDQRPEFRASAELALSGQDSECTQWIKTGIHEAARRDQDKINRDAETARLARELKQGAAAVLGFVATPEQLVLGTKDFIFMLYQRPVGPKVKAAALAAFGSAEDGQAEFLRNGVRVAQAQDQQDIRDANEQASEAEKARLAARDAKARAMGQVLGVVATEGMLVLSDDNFIREVWNRAVPDSEVSAAAVKALRSPDPLVWKAFINTGIFQAAARDNEIAAQKKADADRRRAFEIQTKAENSLVHPDLANAAKRALAGSVDDVDYFVRIGQYSDAALQQSLQADTLGSRGNVVRGDTGGQAVIGTGNLIPAPGDGADATWKIVPGLADPECHSMESATKPGFYLRQLDFKVLIVANDGTDRFRNDATWCARKGLNGSGASFESKSLPGRFLRHYGGMLYAADKSGVHFFDAASLFEPDVAWLIHGTHPTTTSINQRWLNDDQIRGRLGNAVTEEKVESGARWRGYERGRLYWKQSAGVKEVEGEILAAYLGNTLLSNATYGVPVTDETGTPDGVGRYNNFEGGGSIYWTSSTGAHLVYGSIKTLWGEMAWERSYLRYPTADPVYLENGLVRQTFQGGRIDYTAQAGAVAFRN